METEKQVDFNKHSRDIAAVGAKAFGKLVKLKVLVHGLSGVGIEVLKNLVLQGPAAIHIHDDTLVQIRDLGVNFYTNESHVGKISRAKACLDSLRDLNPSVDIQMISGKLDENIFKNYGVVVFTDYYQKQNLIKANEFCRQNGIGFVYTGTLGLFGFAFVDFGNSHEVYDTNGEQVKSAIVIGITIEEETNKLQIQCHEKHDFEEGDTIQFKEVKSMVELNGQEFIIEDVRPLSFKLKGVQGNQLSQYKGEGRVEQVKVTKSFEFKSLRESLDSPFLKDKQEFDLLDWEKIGVPEQLHLILNGVLSFVEKYGMLPNLNNQGDADMLVNIVESENKKDKMQIEGAIKVEEFQQDLIKNVALFARASISPIASFWGGLVAQEVFKYTGKFTPLRQWLYHEMFEALPEEQGVNRNVLNCRYDDYISIFGQDFLQKLRKVKTFMIGAGALGCEYLKMLGLMGISTQEGGQFVVTDDDQIEISNLTRQFLFRMDDVSKSKSECAVKYVKNKMNQELNVEALKLRVCPDNEEVFNDDFWSQLDFVVNAVDNVQARKFVDDQCVWFQKPLFEAGTLGTKCNSQVVIPKFTESYNDSVDPPEKEAPQCTLKNFPNNIHHCISYAREKFQTHLVDATNETIKFIQNQQKYLDDVNLENQNQPGILREKLEAVDQLSQAYIKFDYFSLVEIGIQLWSHYFHNQIMSLLKTYPLDAKTEEGLQFWSGPKKAPDVLNFNPNDQQSILFVQAYANIICSAFGIQSETNVEKVRELALKVKIPEFVPTKIKIQVNENDNNDSSNLNDDDEEVIQKLTQKLRSLNIQEKKKIYQR